MTLFGTFVNVKYCLGRLLKKGHKKVNVPDQVVEKRDVELFNRVKGNPTKVAIDKIVGELDYRLMVELENKN